MRTWAALFVVAMVLGGCSPADTYPMPTEPGGGALLPAGVGQARNTVVLWIPAREGVRLELVTAEALGELEGAVVELFASRPVAHDDGTFVIGEALEPLEGVIVEARPGASSDPGYDTVGIVAELTANAPGTYVVRAIRLSYRLNGGAVRVREGSNLVMTVCVDDPAPRTCPEPTE
jgi:hypothetical protein